MASADRGRHQREAHREPERPDDLIVVQDRPEPAQRRAVERQRDESLVSESDQDDDDQRCGDKGQEERIEQQAEESVLFHDVSRFSRRCA